MFYILILVIFVAFLLFVDFVFVLRLISDLISQLHGAPFVPIPIGVAREALRLASVGPDDILCDLGCGDGRVLRLAVAEFGVKKAVGFEIAIWPYLKCLILNRIYQLKHTVTPTPVCQRLNAAMAGRHWSMGVTQTVEIHRRNLFKANLSRVTVVFLYLYPKLLERLKEKLLKELPSGARVISCGYPIADLKSRRSSTVKGIKIYIYDSITSSTSSS